MPYADYRCCVCGVSGSDYTVRLWPDCYACKDHSWREIVASHDVFVRLRKVEGDYYREHMREPRLLVWASQVLSEFRQDVSTAADLRLPDGLPLLLVPDDVVPQMFACGDVVASLLRSIYVPGKKSEGGRSLRIGDLDYRQMVDEARECLDLKGPDCSRRLAEMFLSIATRE